MCHKVLRVSLLFFAFSAFLLQGCCPPFCPRPPHGPPPPTPPGYSLGLAPNQPFQLDEGDSISVGLEYSSAEVAGTHSLTEG